MALLGLAAVALAQGGVRAPDCHETPGQLGRAKRGLERAQRAPLVQYLQHIAPDLHLYWTCTELALNGPSGRQGCGDFQPLIGVMETANNGGRHNKAMPCQVAHAHSP